MHGWGNNSMGSDDMDDPMVELRKAECERKRVKRSGTPRPPLLSTACRSRGFCRAVSVMRIHDPYSMYRCMGPDCEQFRSFPYQKSSVPRWLASETPRNG